MHGTYKNPILMLLFVVIIGLLTILAGVSQGRDIEELAAVTKLGKTSILDESSIVTEDDMNVRRFAGPSVFYVTPWNFGGYEFVSKFCKKIDIVVPVWYHVFPT